MVRAREFIAVVACCALLFVAACATGSTSRADGGRADRGTIDSVVPDSQVADVGGLDVGTPDAYVSVESKPPAPDVGTEMAAPPPDLAQPDLAQPDLAPDLGPPHGGPLIITEFLADPAAAVDGVAEWLELLNVGSSAIDLENWVLADDDSDTVTISVSIVVQPGARVLLGVNASVGINGGVSGLNAWGKGFVLGNKGDEIVLKDPNGKEVDRVAYTSSWVKGGRSISLRSPSLDNTVLANWCLEDAPWTGSAGDKGSPGGPPTCAP